MPEFDEDRYAEYMDILSSAEKAPLDRFLEGSDLLTNDLEIPSVESVPEISEAIEALIETGAKFSRMTGSGSAVFAMYEDYETRDRACEKISNDPL